MVKFIWKVWPIIKLFLILVAILSRVFIQEVFLYPDIAVIVRDNVIIFFRYLNYDIVEVNSSKGIGVSFKDFFRYVTPTDVDILHGVLIAGCIVFWPFLALATDYLMHNIKKFIENENINIQSGIAVFLKMCIILLLFLPFTFFRYVIILIIFLFLWDSLWWPAHAAIGHQIIGNWILIPGIVLIYNYLMYKYYWKTQFNKYLKNLLLIKRRM